MPTIHISAQKGDISRVVIAMGDPLRVKYVAEHYLTDVKVVNEIRGMHGFSGFYKGHRISIFGHGMGLGSMGIYSHELYTEYEVELIIRAGSCGLLSSDLELGSIGLASEVYSDSIFGKLQGSETTRFQADQGINDLIVKVSKEHGGVQLAPVYTVDSFYTKEGPAEIVNRTKCLLIEMEAFALATNANLLKKKWATILTVSDNLSTGKRLSSQERQCGFVRMMLISLESAIKYLDENTGS